MNYVVRATMVEFPTVCLYACRNPAYVLAGLDDATRYRSRAAAEKRVEKVRKLVSGYVVEVVAVD